MPAGARQPRRETRLISSPSPPSAESHQPNHVVAWEPVEGGGLDICCLSQTGSGWRLEGSLERWRADGPLTFLYRVLLDRRWRTRGVHLEQVWQSTRRQLQLTCDGYGNWWVAGRVAASLRGCLDVDLNLTPATNVLPIRRLDLEVGQDQQLPVAWVGIPELVMMPDEQRYARVAPRTYRFESQSHSFHTQFMVDEMGLVENYPGGWKRKAVPPAVIARPLGPH